MESLFAQLGINWKLLIAQAVNFFLLVALLNYFLYKPLVKLINDRRQKIENGLADAAEADKRIGEADALKREEILKGERAALVIIEDANKDGQERKKEIIELARREAGDIKENAEEMKRRLVQREFENIGKNAGELVREAIFASVRLNPETIDEKLVSDAVAELKQMS